MSRDWTLQGALGSIFRATQMQVLWLSVLPFQYSTGRRASDIPGPSVCSNPCRKLASEMEFRVALHLRYCRTPPNVSTHCDGCGARLSIANKISGSRTSLSTEWFVSTNNVDQPCDLIDEFTGRTWGGPPLLWWRTILINDVLYFVGSFSLDLLLRTNFTSSTKLDE